MKGYENLSSGVWAVNIMLSCGISMVDDMCMKG